VDALLPPLSWVVTLLPPSSWVYCMRLEHCHDVDSSLDGFTLKHLTQLALLSYCRL
jgi:hypothetical protein